MACRNSGGIVSIISKSGANEFHGSAYECHNNSALAARNPMDRVKPSNRSNLAGFTLGGPVVKNRAWLFGQYETYRVRGLQSSLFQAPSDAQRAAAVPAARALMNLYPRPTGAATTFNYGLANNINLNTWLVRGDVALTDRQRLMARYNIAKAVSDVQGDYAGVIDGANNLMFARSIRFGRKFEKPVRVTDKTTPSGNAFSFLAVAPNGDLYAAWLDFRDPQHTAPGTAHVYLTKSTDKGATWGKNIPVANNVCPCCRPAIAFGANGEVFVAWRNVDAEDVRDMTLAVSSDNGASFGKPVLLQRVLALRWCR